MQEVLRELDVCLSGEHIEMTGRKIELLTRVVEGVEDLLDSAEVNGDTQSLRDALAEVRDGP